MAGETPKKEDGAKFMGVMALEDDTTDAARLRALLNQRRPDWLTTYPKARFYGAMIRNNPTIVVLPCDDNYLILDFGGIETFSREKTARDFPLIMKNLIKLDDELPVAK